MDYSAFWWIVAVVSSVISGLALVGILVAQRRLEPFASGTALVTGAAAAYALAMIAYSYQRADAVFYAMAFVLAGVGGGYSLASTLLFRLASPFAPVVISDDELPLDPRVAVIVVSCIEPPHYDPSATAGMLQSLSDEGLLEASVGGLPFLFFAQKARYRSVDDISPSQPGLTAAADMLGGGLADRDVLVDWATCSGESRLAARVAAAVRRGHRRIVVAELSVASSIHMEAARAEVDGLRLEAHGVSLEDTDAVTRSDNVLAMLVTRILNETQGASDPGVVLVGHGQPEERARRRPAFGEAETVLLSRLRMLLAERGIADDRVRIAWSEWVEPDVTSEVRHLAALGCERIVVVPAVFPLDTLSTRTDLQLAAHQARLDDSVVVTVLPAWGPDVVVVDELTTLVVRVLER